MRKGKKWREGYGGEEREREKKEREKEREREKRILNRLHTHNLTISIFVLFQNVYNFSAL